MTIYFRTNIPEMRSLYTFNRATNEVADITRRLETGFRINSAKDDPVGLIQREGLRAEIKGIQAAQKNTTQANQLLSRADSSLSNIATALQGEIDDSENNGLLGLVTSFKSDMNAEDSMKLKQQIGDVLNQIDGMSRSTVYNGKQIINGGLAYKTSYNGTNNAKISDLNITRAKVGGDAIDIVATSATRTTADFDLSTNKNMNNGSVTVTVNGKDYVYSRSGDAADVDVSATLKGALNTILSGSGVTVYDENDTDIPDGVTVASDHIAIVANDPGAETTIAVTVVDGASSNGVAAPTVTDGKDADVTVGGEAAYTKGNYFSLSSADLSLSGMVGEALTSQTSTLKVDSGGATYQIGKNVLADMQLKFGLNAVNTSTLGGQTGKLSDLMTLDFTKTDDQGKAFKIVNEAIDSLANTRAQIGTIQNGVLETNLDYLASELTETTAAEAAISNANVAEESSRLNRAELLAQNALNALVYNRSFANFVVQSMWQ